MKKQYYVLFPLVILLILSGCGPKYQKINLEPLTEQTKQYQETKNGITIRAKTLDEAETKAIFGKNAQKLFEENNYYFRKKRKVIKAIQTPIIPIQISITNNSLEPISFEKEDIELPLLDYKWIHSLLELSTSKRVLATVGIGLIGTIAVGVSTLAVLAPFTFPITCPCAFGLWFVASALTSGAFLCTVVPGTAIYQSVKTKQANQLLQEDIKENSITNKIIVQPEEQKNMLFFVSDVDFKSEFDFSVHTPQDTNTFKINLNQKQNNEFLS